MPTLSRDRIHGYQEIIQKDSHTTMKETFRSIFKPYISWKLQQDCDQKVQVSHKYMNGVVNYGVSGEETQRNFRNPHHNYLNSKTLRQFNYFLSGILSIIILLLAYISFITTYISDQPSAEMLALKQQPSLAGNMLQERTASDRAKIIIPAYFGPEDTASWGEVISQISKFRNVLGFAIVINPSNGPGSPAEIARYVSLINTLSKYRNVQILGYIHQSWGHRDITGDVNTWITYFPGKLDGFFLDEMPSEKSTSNLGAVSNNNAYIKKKSSQYFRSGSPFIIQNPGTEVDSSFYDLSFHQDVTVVMENTEDLLKEWIKLERASAQEDVSSLGMILLAVSNPALESVVQTMLLYSRYIFATNLNETTAYLKIASDWGLFTKYVYKYGGTGSRLKITTTPRPAATKTQPKRRKSTKRRFPTATARQKGSLSIS